ncbi:MAG: hypothetical protein U1E06_01330 [Tabrizicola sp.]|uniref:hypothetical protein n=1 Tax=Tabrizicola sp. TaxID=2005166 RepID=UPI0027364A40|nr:hypothetical protein [Tabrizicola sp.]MDP3264533.1 hypothetical protein [Tabrizicola sp.]MDP3649487.1 hypothetical protein [Paracoccaceae bacterium]MDZ4065487.1 hypothetical protein [Tabrizicola sp.]
MAAKLLLGAMLLAAAPLAAQTVPVETSTLGTSAITLHLHPFLTEEELTTLRLVMTNEQALSLFVPGTPGHAALAVSPDDGFIRVGAPMGSATAVADLPDAAAAAAAALAGCDAAKQTEAPCVVVLEIAPAP